MRVLGRPDVKICGVCEPQDAAMAVRSGATHIGVVRVPGRKRTRSVVAARAVCEASAGAMRVGVYANATNSTILREVETLGLDVVQLHGREGPDRAESLARRGVEVWKVVKPVTAEALLEAARHFASVDLLLVEGRSELDPTTAGERFRWGEVAAAIDLLPVGTLIGIAGGLTPDNVQQAIRRFRPSLVDVSAGVEVVAGRKDPARVGEFIRRARGVRESGRDGRVG